MALCLAEPSGSCCAQAAAPLRSLAAHCETIELIALRLSLPSGSEFTHAAAPCGSFAAQLEATACKACERSWPPGNCAALAAAVAMSRSAHSLKMDWISPQCRWLELELWKRSSAACG